MQRQIPAVQVVQKTVEVPLTQFVDRVVDTPVLQQRQVRTVQMVQKTMENPTVQTAQKTMENPQAQFLDEVVGMPAVVQRKVPVVQEGEMYPDEDETNKTKVEGKNGLEKCCVATKNTVTEEKLNFKCDAGDKEKPEKAVQSASNWSDKIGLERTMSLKPNTRN